MAGSWLDLSLCAFGLCAAACLGGCVETVATAPPQAELQQGPARRDGVSPRGASVALASLSGVPEPVADRIKTAFAQEAVEREITIADSKNADYLVRGYLDATPTESGTAITLVLDIFDAAKKRALRLKDALFVNGETAGADPWSTIDVASIGNMAAKTAEDLAAFLTTTPEARAEARAKPAPAPIATSTAAAGRNEGRTIVQRAPSDQSASKAMAGDLSVAALP